MGLTGIRGTFKPRKILGDVRITRQMYDYLWHGRGAADPLDKRTAHVRKHFAAMLDFKDLDMPAGTLDPFIDYVADKLARLVPEADATVS
jgi:hypothetical protein